MSLRRSLRLRSRSCYNTDDIPIISTRASLNSTLVSPRVHGPKLSPEREPRKARGWQTDNFTAIKAQTTIKNICLSLPDLKTLGYLLLTIMLISLISFALSNLIFARKNQRSGLKESPVSRNFALDTQGATVIQEQSSSTYKICFTVFGLPIRCSPVNPDIVIQERSHLLPGACWAFAGEQGHLVIALSHPVTISYVTVGHISRSLFPSRTIPSSPKEFSVYGMRSLHDRGTLLGTFLYDQHGDSFQDFKLPDHKKGVYKFVKLQVHNNWGNPEHTCLYSFRVHGELAG